MDAFRSKAVITDYLQKIEAGHLEHGCRLCEKPPITDFEFWKIVENSFPYDKLAEKHTMLLPKRHVTEVDLTEDERTELLVIKSNSLQAYEFVFESLPHKKSIPAHFHLHLIVPKNLPD